MEILLLGERFDAQQALAWGLVNRVVPAAELDAAVARVVQSLADGPGAGDSQHQTAGPRIARALVVRATRTRKR